MIQLDRCNPLFTTLSSFYRHLVKTVLSHKTLEGTNQFQSKSFILSIEKPLINSTNAKMLQSQINSTNFHSMTPSNESKTPILASPCHASNPYESYKTHLENGDSDLSRLGNLRNNNMQDTILQSSLNTIMFNALREREASGEGADLAFRNPESWLGGFGFLLWCGSLRSDCCGGSWGCKRGISLIVVILYSCGVRFLGRGIDVLLGFDCGSFGLRDGGACSKGFPFDNDCLGVCEFDVQVFLCETWDFAEEFVGGWGFSYVEARCEDFFLSLLTRLAATSTCWALLLLGVWRGSTVELREKLEESCFRRQVCLWEERHCECCFVWVV